MFLSREIALCALERGHEVTCAARGVSGQPPPGARFVQVDRSRSDGLAALGGETYDAVVDVARQAVSQVRAAVDALGSRTAHWTYVSSRSVYREPAGPDLAPSDELLDPAPAGTDEADPRQYGHLKVAAENAVRDQLGDRAFIPRPGLIAGRGDVSDRYGYWPVRLRRGGTVLCPGDPGTPVQLIDVRDLAGWIVRAAETGVTGVFDATAPPMALAEVIDRTARAVGADATPAWVDAGFLTEHDVQPWSGRRSLPLWVPPEMVASMGGRDVSRSLDAGLEIRPLEDTARDALAWELELGAGRERRAGLTPAEEAELLAAWQARPAGG